MSIKLMTAVWSLDLHATDKLVLLGLADWSNDEGHCWPSVAKLRGKCSLSERAVQMALGRLETAGHLTRHYANGRGTRYVVHPRTSCTPAPAAPPQPVRPARDAATPAPAAPNTSRHTITPSKASPSSGKRATGVPLDFEPVVASGSITAVTMQAWSDQVHAEQIEQFIDHHVSKGTTSRDWQASWRTWVKNWKRFNGQSRSIAPVRSDRGPRADPSLALFNAAIRAEAQEERAAGCR